MARPRLELYNRTDDVIDLSGWHLTNDPRQPTKWTCPGGTIKKSGFIVLFASGRNEGLHTNFRLSRKGGYLGLFAPSSTVAEHALKIPPQHPDRSYGLAGQPGFLTAATPGAPNKGAFWQPAPVAPSVSVGSGYHDAPVTVAITHPEQVELHYALNDKEGTYQQPLVIDRTSVLAVWAVVAGAPPSLVESFTYVFVDDLLEQGRGLPEKWGAIRADYALAPKTDPEQLAAALRSIPTLFVTTSSVHLFGKAGIFAQGDEERIKKPAQVELLPGFRSRAAIAPHSKQLAKRSMRLSFTGKFGDGALRQPLFADAAVNPSAEAVPQHQLILRAGDDLSWQGEWAEHATYLRDQWVRDSQIAMADRGARGIFVHLFLNNLYWGLYNLIERPNASFSAAHYGGRASDCLPFYRTPLRDRSTQTPPSFVSGASSPKTRAS